MRQLTSRFCILLASFTASLAAAICPAPEAKVCSAFFTSDKVFYGKVVSIANVNSTKGDPGTIRFTIQVDSIFKGTVAATETVETENSSARWIADVGDRRVVFARGGRVSNLCSPIDQAANTDETIRSIRLLQGKSGATIEGTVVIGSGPGGTPAAGVEVAMSGIDRTYKATTDDKGNFSIVVDPGHYEISSLDLRAAIPYSRPDTSGFDLVDGQCAQFLLSKSSVR